MAEGDAKVNMSLDDIIKLERKDKKKKVMVNGKDGRNRPGKPQRGPRGNNQNNNQNRARLAGKRNANSPKKGQAWRLQRQQNNGFVAKRYQQNGGPKRVQSMQNLKNIGRGKSQQNQQNQQSQQNRPGFVARRAAAMQTAGKGMVRSRSRNNVAGNKRFLAAPKGLKRVNSLPNLRDPNSVYNRLGYQSPAQVAYRNRVKRAKQLLLQRQSQRVLPNERMAPRAAKSLNNLQQRAIDRHQQLLRNPRGFNAGGLRSDQILRAQRRQQYSQKLLRMNAARANPNTNVNFMCTLGDEFGARHRPRSMSQGGGHRRQLSRGRSPFRQTPQNIPQMPRGPMYRGRARSRSRSRSRSRTRPAPLIHNTTNVDDRTFSEVMYSVSNNLGVTGRTLNDRFTF